MEPKVGGDGPAEKKECEGLGEEKKFEEGREKNNDRGTNPHT